jgi:hypothetical protein
LLHLAWIIPLLLLIFFFASPRYRGDIAESRVRRILAQGLDKKSYTVLNDLVVPFGGGTIAIDHVVVSRFGIFVIESQYARGWVAGTDVQDRWKQHSLGRISRFDNPLHRNRLQAEALQSLLDYPRLAFHRIVVMTGQKGFKTEIPQNVVEPEKLIRYMRKKGQHQLTPEQTTRALNGIESARLRPRGGVFIKPIVLARLALLLVLFAGIYLAFADELDQLGQAWSKRGEVKANPDAFHPDGRAKSEQELWEDSLRCAWSEDTGRCACYEPGGTKADLALEKCRELAERGSILKQ